MRLKGRTCGSFPSGLRRISGEYATSLLQKKRRMPPSYPSPGWVKWDQLEISKAGERGVLYDRASSSDDVCFEQIGCATSSLTRNDHGLYPLLRERIKVIAFLRPGRFVGCFEERERNSRGRVEFQSPTGLILVFVCRPPEARVVGDLLRGSDNFLMKGCGGCKIPKEVWRTHSRGEVRWRDIPGMQPLIL